MIIESTSSFIRIMNDLVTHEGDYRMLKRLAVLILAAYCIIPTNEVCAEVLYYHSDHLNSTGTLATDQAEVAGEMQYYPFGEIYRETDPSLTDYTYSGQEQDGQTDLMYYQARYYDTSMGRFTSPDIRRGTFSPQNLNRYAYVLNRPLTYVDPNGEWAIPAYSLVVFSIAVAGAAIHTYINNPPKVDLGNIPSYTPTDYTNTGTMIHPHTGLERSGPPPLTGGDLDASIPGYNSVENPVSLNYFSGKDHFNPSLPDLSDPEVIEEAINIIVQEQGGLTTVDIMNQINHFSGELQISNEHVFDITNMLSLFNDANAAEYTDNDLKWLAIGRGVPLQDLDNYLNEHGRNAKPLETMLFDEMAYTNYNAKMLITTTYIYNTIGWGF